MAETITMEAFLSTIGQFFTQSVTWMGDLVDVILENPALTIITFGVGIVGFSVGLLSRLTRV